MKYENITFVEALRELAERAGITLPEEDLSQEDEMLKRRKTLFDINRDAANYYFKNLQSDAGRIGLEYLKARGLSDDIINDFGLGYSNQTFDDLVKYLRNKGYADDYIIDSGLALNDDKRGFHDIFGSRVMFPIADGSGKVIGFGGRIIREGNPKYLNSPETPIYIKNKNLFALDKARKSGSGYFILCEGYMDAISLHQAGFDMAVASLGTALTKGQAMLMKRYTDTVYFAYDNDNAGIKAVVRGIEILKETGLKGRVIELAPYKDPDEFIKNNWKEAFEERIKNAENMFYLEIGVLESHYDMRDPASKTEYHRKVAAMLCEFDEPLERNNYIEAAALKLNVNEDDLRKMVHTVDMESAVTGKTMYS